MILNSLALVIFYVSLELVIINGICVLLWKGHVPGKQKNATFTPGFSSFQMYDVKNCFFAESQGPHL